MKFTYKYFLIAFLLAFVPSSAFAGGISSGSIDDVTTVATITEVANVTSLDTVDTVTEVANVTSVDTVDTVTGVTTVSTVTAVTDITNAVTVHEDFFESSVSLTRPANVTPYSSGDSCADSDSAPNDIEILNVGSANGDFIEITNAHVTTNNTSTTQVLVPMTLHLFSSAPTATNDNAAMTSTVADRANSVGTLKLNQFDIGKAYYDGNPIKFQLGAATTTLFALLEINGAYTPESAEVFTVYVSGVRGE